MNPYIRALRAPFLAGSLVPVVLGGAFAFAQHAFSLPPFLLALAGVGALHLGANLLNDYWDARGSDPVNLKVTPFSGGSRVIQEGALKEQVVLFLALAFFAVGLATGILLVWMGRPLVLLLGGLGFFAGWAYSARPLQLMSRGWGEVVIFLAFGPLVTLGTGYVLTGALSHEYFVLGLPQGFLISGVIWINQFPDYEADRNAGKRNLVVRLGPARSRFPYAAIMAMAFACVPLLIRAVPVTSLTMLCFAALPTAFKAVRTAWRHYLSHDLMVPAQELTIRTLVIHGVLFSAGLVLGRLTGF